jgi:Cu2+-containing amine oxidase
LANPFLNAFTTKHRALKTESEGARDHDAASNRFWLIANDNKKNKYGDSVAYALLPYAEGVTPFAHDDGHLIQRAPFLKKPLWVTPYHPDENFPGTVSSSCTYFINKLLGRSETELLSVFFFLKPEHFRTRTRRRMQD